MVGQLGTRAIALGLLVALALACGGDPVPATPAGTPAAPGATDAQPASPGVSSPTGDGGATTSTDLDACGSGNDPCTLEDADPAAAARAEQLVAGASDMLGPSGDDIEAAADWLRQQEGVADVAVGESMVRFRVAGGRATWLFAYTADSVPSLSGVSFDPPPRSATAADSAIPAGGRGDRALLDGTTGGQEKKALLLSPFRWQWEVGGWDDGIAAVKSELEASRDYTGGVTVLVDRLGEADGSAFIEGDIGLPSWTSWKDFDYIHVLTHGGFVCGPGGVASTPEGGGCLTALMTSWTLEVVESAAAGAAAGDTPHAAKLADLWRSVGVEFGYISIRHAERRLPEARGLRYKAGDGGAFNDDPGQSTAEATHVGPFVLLTSRFFAGVYGGGLQDAVVMINACSGGRQADLLQALSGRNSAVLGWDRIMTIDVAAQAGAEIARALMTVDRQAEPMGGLSVADALEVLEDDIRARLRLSESGGAPAPLLSVADGAIVAPLTGATLDFGGDGTVRAREIVYLVDERGREIGARPLRAIGLPGDGQPDKVQVIVQVDGLGRAEDVAAIGLRADVDGREMDIEAALDRQVSEGVWQADAEIPLGRDVEPGERLTIEIIAVLPEGGDSRWEYSDLAVCAATENGVPVPFALPPDAAYQGTAQFPPGADAWRVGNLQAAADFMRGAIADAGYTIIDEPRSSFVGDESEFFGLTVVGPCYSLAGSVSFSRSPEMPPTMLIWSAGGN